MKPNDSLRQPRVAVVYPYFPHYREPILQELLQSPCFDYWLVGDREDRRYAGIPAADFARCARFIYAPSRFLFGRFLVQARVVSLAVRRDFDAIIYLGDAQFITTWLSALLARLSGKRVLFWTHGWLRRERGFKNLVRTSFYRLSHGLLLYGRRAWQIGIQKGFDPRRLYVIYNSLDYEKQKAIRSSITEGEIRQLRQHLFEHPELPMVIFIGRLVEQHGLALLVEAVSKLMKAGHLVNALIVGDGPERAGLERQAASHALPIRFYGACYDDEILGRLMMAANVAVVPEKLGLAAMHALGFGTPVITHDNPEEQGPEWEAIRPGINGDFYRQGDVASLVERIRQWTLTSFIDAERRGTCYQIVEQHYTPRFQRVVIEQALAGEAAQ